MSARHRLGRGDFGLPGRVAGPGLLLAAVLFGIGWPLLWYNGHVADDIRRSGTPVQATVTEVHNGYRIDSIEVEYTRRDRRQQRRIVVPSADRYETGEPITVFVIEGNPDRLSTPQGYTSEPAWRVQFAITFTGAGALLAGIVFLRGGWSLGRAMHRKASA
jgi:hypothetical protein